jgi:hypothetical protein
MVANAQKRYTNRVRSLALVLSILGLGLCTACKDSTKLSVAKASAHAGFLAETIKKDVGEVRPGLPVGAEALAQAWKADATIETDSKAAQRALEDARKKVQDLRVAKSTFFALADTNGTVIRNDQEQDRMAGHSLFSAFSALSDAKSRYVETSGSMPEASGVRAPRADGQWVAAAPVQVAGVTKGLYVTGWSWSAYAYRLEFALRSRIRSELMGKPTEKEPLTYVYMLVGKAAYGAPVTPEVNMKAIADLDPLARTKGEEVLSQKIEVTGREYGLAVKRTPILGPDVAVAVMRSET